MIIYIKTPPVAIGDKKSSFYAHLLEHIAITNHNNSPSDYYIFNNRPSSVNHQFTTHHIHQYNLKYVKQVFMRTVARDTVKREHQMLKLEDEFNR